MSAHTGICIVWPAWFLGSADPELHSTAAFLGNTDNITPDRAVIEEVLTHFQIAPGPVKVTGTALFGKDGNVPVATLANPALDVMQAWLLRELDARGVWVSTAFDFNPHVTFSQETFGAIPHFIQLEPPVLWWGNERTLHSKHTKAEVTA